MTKGLCVPLMETWWKVHCKTAKWTWKPLESFNKWFWDLPNAGLWFCGFIAILGPIHIGYVGIFLAMQLLVALIFMVLGFTQGLMFVMIGIWPVFILSICICGVTIATLPQNIYYHALVTYRTVMLRRNLKLLSFILMPFTHILIPPVTLIIAFFTLLPWFVAKSFIGFPLDPWENIERISKKAWKKFYKDTKAFANNYGHESGIPQDWDGTVHGLAVDPLVVIIALFLYLIGIIGMSPVIFVIFIIKVIPIFLETLIQFWRNISVMTAVVWWIRVLTASHDDTVNQNHNNQRHRSPAPGWIKCLKSAIKGIKRGIEGYGKLKIFKIYRKTLNDYCKKVKKINPSKLGDLVNAYFTDFSPVKVIPSNVGAEIIILWIPILMVFMMWILGFILVLTIPPATFLTVFLLWLIFWPVVILAPPVLYLLGWILIIFGLPVSYVLLWCSILVGPWIFCAVGSLTGPILALQIPFCMMAYNRYNPIIIWDNARRSLSKGYKNCRAIDRYTTRLSFCKIRVFCGDNPIDEASEEVKESRGAIEYWDLYAQKCVEESKIIQTKNWLSSDDILSVSPTASIAVPGVTIASILQETVNKSHKKDRVLVYWNENNICKDSNRDPGDNIANVFLPQLMKIKELIMDLPKEDVEHCCIWIKAKLCDGEDEKSEELSKVLDDTHAMADGVKAKCLKIRSLIENVVHALLRVKEMNNKLPIIFSSSITDENEPSPNQSLMQANNLSDDMQHIEIDIDPNEDNELALAINLSIEDERARQEAISGTVRDNAAILTSAQENQPYSISQPTESQNRLQGNIV